MKQEGIMEYVFCQIVEQQWQQEDGIIPRFWKGRLEQ